jgi:uncharacterized protein YndB with AHSA1/START domain
MATLANAAEQDVVSTEVFIAAPPARVFQAITDPAQMLHWWGRQDHCRTEECNADLRVGGKWSNRGVKADGTAFRIEGEYLEIDPPRLLVHTWRSSSIASLETVVRWELEAQTVHGLYPSGPHRAGTGTLVRILHRGFGANTTAAADHYRGWQQALGWLRAFLETPAESPASVRGS